jgi:hypothetical protein
MVEREAHHLEEEWLVKQDYYPSRIAGPKLNHPITAPRVTKPNHLNVYSSLGMTKTS